MDKRILIIDDEQDFLESLRRGLITANTKDVMLESSALEAAKFFREGGTVEIALIDVTMPGMSGLELLEVIGQHSPETQCIMITAVNDASIAIKCIKKGAYDYLLKPVSRDDLLLAINRAAERRRLIEIADLPKQKSIPRLNHAAAFKQFTIGSPNIMRLLKEAELHAGSDVPVLITGETGTGKELLAKAVHEASRRSGKPFTAVNMAALTATLFDAEFFGHTRGAFTGAEKDRAGFLEHTEGGTIFLDEIGTLSPEMQGKLLRVLQEQEYYKIGTSRPRKSDVRFIAATNANLERMVANGSFRKDLYYRIKGAWLNMPPLRERRDDIPALVKAFIEEISVKENVTAIHEDAMSLLMTYDYPGNIRELKFIVQSSINLALDRTITVSVLPDIIRKLQSKRKIPSNGPEGAEKIVPLAYMEKNHISYIYEHTGKNKTRAAELLCIGLNTLRRKLKDYGID